MDDDLIFETSLALDDDSARITFDLDILKALESVCEVAKDVAASSGPLFACVVRNNAQNLGVLRTTPLGRKLLRCLRQWSRVRWHFLGHAEEMSRLQAHPWVALVLSIPVEEAPAIGKSGDAAQMNRRCAVFHQHVERLRESARSTEFVDKVTRFERHSRDSERSLLRYLKALSDRHAKLLVLRVDLGYRHDPSKEPLGPREPPGDLHRHRALMVQFFESKFADTYVGYIIKTEFGLYKGPHLHAVFILDGSKLKSDVAIATMLGEYWKTRVTKGRGTYFNCNRIKGTYKNSGIGLMDYRKPDDWLGAQLMVKYITAVDYFVRPWAEGHRTLVKGWMPKLGQTKRGRPRTKHYGDEGVEAVH